MPEKIQLLVGESNDNDQTLLGWNVERLNLNLELHFAANPDEVIDYLKNQPRPGAVLMNFGHRSPNTVQILEWIRGHPRLADLPVIVWSDSLNPKERERALKAGATRYFNKPDNLEDYAPILAAIPNVHPVTGRD